MLFGKLQRDPDCDYEKGSIAQVNVLAIVECRDREGSPGFPPLSRSQQNNRS
jgi:hypothetical protein